MSEAPKRLKIEWYENLRPVLRSEEEIPLQFKGEYIRADVYKALQDHLAYVIAERDKERQGAEHQFEALESANRDLREENERLKSRMHRGIATGIQPQPKSEWEW